MKTPILIITATFLILSQTACRSSLERMTGSSTVGSEGMIGLERKELLKDRVKDARNEQIEAQKSFQAALNQFKSLYTNQSKDLEKKYRALQFAYEDSLRNSEGARNSSKKIEPVAQNLFSDWEKDIEKIDTVSLKAQSREALAESRNNYATMESHFKTSEEKMVPVLQRFNDQVHYLKYNLDAKSLAAARSDNLVIQNEMERLILDLKKSIAAADEFIRKLPTN